MPEREKSSGQPAGTRFRLFAQPPFLAPFSKPETVVVSSPAGTVGPGPADRRMYVIDPIGKRMAYGQAEDRRGNAAYLLPPWPGPVFPPAIPDADGHFDHIPVESPEFEAAHLFGAVRLTLDIWEKYFGHRIDWHFRVRFRPARARPAAQPPGKRLHGLRLPRSRIPSCPQRSGRAVQPELRRGGARSRPLHRLLDGGRSEPRDGGRGVLRLSRIRQPT